MIKRILLLFFLCYSFFLNSQNVFATQKQINLTQFCTKNGLPQNDIHSIVQDKMGFMWFASNDGLRICFEFI